MSGYRLFCLGVLASICTPAPAHSTEPPARKPNVVFILADDLGVNDLGCYGRKDQQTPHLDKLAAQGMRFTTAYCAQPICSPTRAAIMTGKTPARLHLTTFLPGRADAPSQKLLHPKINLQLPLEEKTIAELLKEAGYATACIGKWHLGGVSFGPKEQGFDFVHAGQANTTPSETEGGKGEYDLTRQAEKFIADNKDRSFFLYLAHNNPHVRLAAKPELVQKYKDSFNPIYAAMIHTLDDSVGLVLAQLEELKLTANTIVIFTSDNGGLHVLESPNTPATHNTPYRAGKGFLYEGGLRVPAIMRWPGQVPAGRTMDTPIISTDWVPTLLELCGVKPPVPLDGGSLAGLLRGGELAARPLLWHFPHYTNQGGRPGGAIRDGDWKLIEYYEDGRAELFNLARDVGETRDLAAEEPKRVAALKDQLAAWRKAIGAQENTPNPNFNAALHQRLYVDIDVSALKAGTTAAEMRPKLEAWREGMNAVLPKKKPTKP
jgi:arylsulfatase A